MSQVTSINNRRDSLIKEEALILPKFNDSKIIFKNNYNKNRNLLKSLVIKLPFSQEKSINKFQMFQDNLETDRNINSILKNSLRKRLNHDLPNERKSFKNVKFIDEADEEDPSLGYKSYNLNEKMTNNISPNNNEKGKIYLNANSKNIQFNTQNAIIENKKDDSSVNSIIKQNIDNNNCNSNKINKKGNEQRKTTSNKSLAEIIIVPSYRKFNVYRTNSKDFNKKNMEEEESHAKCKCCTIF